MAKLVINAERKLSHINKELQGHFSEHLGRCIYEGLYVGENSEIPNVNGMRTDVVEALKQIRIPVLRWPGGCFADEYHWKDGIGPKEGRKKIVNTHWGGVVEDNSFGTHEFFELCRQLGCETYINGNMGSGTVQEMSEWVEYMTFEGVSPMADLRTKNGHKEAWTVDYFGVGNENWGCGGNMNPDFYGNMYRRYQTYVRNYAGNKPIKKIACGANVDDYEWTEEVMKTTFRRNEPGQHGFMDGLSLHYYTHPGGWLNKGSATEFDEKKWYQTMKKTWYMDELITRHGAIMDKYDPQKKIGLMVDEWGTWWDEEPGTINGHLYQQNTMRDAFVAALTLNVFHKYTDRVRMTNIAQIVNVLQSMILTNGPKMLLTPTYYVFQMYNVHQDATFLPMDLICDKAKVRGGREVPMVSASASKDKNGRIHISLANVDVDNVQSITLDLQGQKIGSVKGRILTSASINDHNTFEKPDVVKPATFDGAKIEKGQLKIDLPAKSIVVLEVK